MTSLSSYLRRRTGKVLRKQTVVAMVVAVLFETMSGFAGNVTKHAEDKFCVFVTGPFLMSQGHCFDV